jgi:hypothetical protein
MVLGQREQLAQKTAASGDCEWTIFTLKSLSHDIYGIYAKYGIYQWIPQADRSGTRQRLLESFSPWDLPRLEWRLTAGGKKGKQAAAVLGRLRLPIPGAGRAKLRLSRGFPRRTCL